MKRLQKIAANDDIGKPNFIGPPQIDRDVKAAYDDALNGFCRELEMYCNQMG